MRARQIFRTGRNASKEKRRSDQGYHGIFVSSKYFYFHIICRSAGELFYINSLSQLLSSPMSLLKIVPDTMLSQRPPAHCSYFY